MLAITDNILVLGSTSASALTIFPDALTPPISKIAISPRDKSGLKELEVPVDKKILEAGDHNGSTFYQHQKFILVVDGQMSPEVTLDDGIWAVRMGHAAQVSAETGKVISF